MESRVEGSRCPVYLVVSRPAILGGRKRQGEGEISMGGEGEEEQDEGES